MLQRVYDLVARIPATMRGGVVPGHGIQTSDVAYELAGWNELAMLIPQGKLGPRKLVSKLRTVELLVALKADQQRCSKPSKAFSRLFLKNATAEFTCSARDNPRAGRNAYSARGCTYFLPSPFFQTLSIQRAEDRILIRPSSVRCLLKASLCFMAVDEFLWAMTSRRKLPWPL